MMIAAAIVAILLALTGGGMAVRRHHKRLAASVARAEALLDAEGHGSLFGRTLRSLDAMVELGERHNPRSLETHAATGLPTREPLLARMENDRAGTLAVFAFKDHDRLCAFDPALGEQLLLALAGRLAAMVPASRLIAHVDRGHLAVWSGADAGATSAEFDSLVYALGDRVLLGEREVLPEVALRQASFDVSANSAPAMLARTMASFAVVAAPAGTTPIDPQAIARERFLLEQDLRQAVTRGELALQLQPLVDAGEGRVCGAEALIRWHHPTRGLVPPSRFVPVMEAAGLSNEIGLWMLNAAVREASRWRIAGLGPLRVAVNVSGRQLEGQNLAMLVERTLARHSVGADALEIELTESVAMGDGARAAELFATLHLLGVKIAIDDFGTGFSSLSTLRTLSFDKIKIDREFVTRVHDRRDSQAICQSVLALGRGLGIRVLAEGVEDRAEYAWLRRHGCQLFQGFHFAQPLDPAAFEAFARDRAGLARLLDIGRGDTALPLSERLTA